MNPLAEGRRNPLRIHATRLTVKTSVRRLLPLYAAAVVALAFGVLANPAGASPRNVRSSSVGDVGARAAVAAPCASQGACGYCGIGGIGTGQCTKSKLAANVAWCARHSRNLGGNGQKCRVEAGWLSDLDNTIFTRCNIASALAAAGISKETRYWLQLTDLSDPWVGGLSWLASTLGAWYVNAYCKHH